MPLEICFHCLLYFVHFSCLQNVDLLNQFISPETGEVISYTKTGECNYLARQ